MSTPELTTLLIANRGEIACRIMRTAKTMGLTTVAVHSAIDRDTRHSREADIRVDLGGSKAARQQKATWRSTSLSMRPGQAVHKRFTPATVFCPKMPTLPVPLKRQG